MNETCYLSLSNNPERRILVDLHWFKVIGKYTWYEDKDGYVYRNMQGVGEDGKIWNCRVSLSRYINGTPKGFVTDHINGNLDDYRQANLRTVTHSQNHFNVRKQVRGNTTSKYKGVSFHSKVGRWRAYVRGRNKQISLGFHSTELEAAYAYDLAVEIVSKGCCDIGKNNVKHLLTDEQRREVESKVRRSFIREGQDELPDTQYE